jgi:hypothetical protein
MGLELTLRSAYPREAFALQLTPLGHHLGSRKSNPKSLGSFHTGRHCTHPIRSGALIPGTG